MKIRVITRNRFPIQILCCLVTFVKTFAWIQCFLIENFQKSFVFKLCRKIYNSIYCVCIRINRYRWVKVLKQFELRACAMCFGKKQLLYPEFVLLKDRCETGETNAVLTVWTIALIERYTNVSLRFKHQGQTILGHKKCKLWTQLPTCK